MTAVFAVLATITLIGLLFESEWAETLLVILVVVVGLTTVLGGGKSGNEDSE